MAKRKKVVTRIRRLTRRMDAAYKAGAGDENPVMREYDGAVKRLRATMEGKEASKRIAKARAAKKKKAPITQLAINLNDDSNKKIEEIRKARNLAVKEARKLTARKFRSETGLKKKTAQRDWRVAQALESRGKVDQYLPDKAKDMFGGKSVESYRARAARQQVASKGYARISGGYATSMKRNAEAGLGHIVRGRALKSAARGAGVLGMVALFAKALSGKDKKKGRS